MIEETTEKEVLGNALGWLKTFVVGGAIVLLLMFALLATATVWTLVSIHTGQVHGAQHTQEILNTVTSHNNTLQHTLTNTCTLLAEGRCSSAEVV